MVRGVNARTAPAREERVAATETRLVEAATRLFVRHGYVATTLAAVAEEAGVAPRTVYLRFGTKVALFTRVMDVAVVGDTAPVELARRPASRQAVTAPTLAERLRHQVDVARDVMGRLGPLLEVAEQAAALEPTIAAAARAGRAATRDQMRRFWTALHDDGLLPAGADVGWLVDTAVATCSADSFLHLQRTLGWSADTYAEWLGTTWARLVDASTARPSPPGRRPAPGRRPPPGSRSAATDRGGPAR